MCSINSISNFSLIPIFIIKLILAFVNELLFKSKTTKGIGYILFECFLNKLFLKE